VADLSWVINEDHVGDVARLMLITSAGKIRLDEIDLLPRIWIVIQVSIRVYSTRAELLEEPNHGRRARTSIDPNCQWCRGRICVAGFEEPEEDVLVLFDVHISTERLHSGRGLTDAIRDFLPADLQTVVARGSSQICGSRDELRLGYGSKNTKHKTGL
jgi:hypothetical protein